MLAGLRWLLAIPDAIEQLGALPERRPRGSPADGPAAVAAPQPGHDQAAVGGGGSAALDLLPHVPGDGDHGVPVERGHPRARAADRGARVAEDDEALRPDGGHDHRRRDRTHRDLNQADPLDGLEPSLRPPTLTVGILRLRPSPVEEPGRGIERGNGWRNTVMPAGTQERTRTRGRHKTTEQTSAETPPGLDGG